MIHEKCSCGASLKIDHKQAIRYLREWRASHTCVERDSDDVVFTSGESRVEMGIGFQADALVLPAKEYDPFDDE